MVFPIYRIGPYEHNGHRDNFAIVAAEGPESHIRAQTLLQRRIEFLYQEAGIGPEYNLLGRIDETGFEADREGVIYMSLQGIDGVRQRELMGQVGDPYARFRQ
tara:strand:- start:2065 stop:2373 length:309 start_codon:yes stop_codon:yes gene_type:complete